MTVAQLVHVLRAHGVRVSAEGDRLRLRGPTPTPELRATIDAHRATLLRLLKTSDGRDARPVEPQYGAAPLSRGQRQLWFEQQRYPDSWHYNVPLAIRVGRVNAPAIEQALGEIVNRHAVLRSRVRVRGEDVVMEIDPGPPSFTLAIADLPASSDDLLLTSAVLAFVQRPFDMQRESLFRGCLVRRGHDAVLVISLHHIVADGWSMGILMEDFRRAYIAISAGHACAASGSTPAFRAPRARTERESAAATLAAARTLLEDVPALELPYDFSRPEIPTHRGGACTGRVSTADVERLARVARQCRSTTFGVFVAAFAVVLSHETTQLRFPIGSDVAGRDEPDSEEIVGHVVNQIVMAIDLSGNPTLDAIVTRTAESFVSAHALGAIPFDVLTRTVRTPTDRRPLFHAKIVMQRPLRDSLRPLGFDILDVHNGTAKYDLLLNVWLSDDGAGLTVEYSRDVFADQTGARVLSHLLSVLAWIRDETPSPRLADLHARLSRRDRTHARLLASSLRRSTEVLS